jgi:hypothetical protein
MKSMQVLAVGAVVSVCALGGLAAHAATPAKAVVSESVELSGATPPLGGKITFDLSHAVLGGDACNTSDGTKLQVAAGPKLDVAAVVSPFDLSGGANAARSACTIRVPFTIGAGYYLDAIRIKPLYDAIKSANPSLSLTFSVGAFSQTGATVGVDLASGAAASLTGASADETKSFAAPSSCSQSTSGLLAINVAFSASGVGASDRARAELKSLVLREATEIIVLPCP